MDDNQPIKADPSAIEDLVDSSIKSEPVDDPFGWSSPPPPRIASSQPVQDISTIHTDIPAEDLSPGRSVSAHPHASAVSTDADVSVPIKADPEIRLSQELNQEPSQEPDSEFDSGETGPEETKYLERLISQHIPESLESGVTIGLELLGQLKAQLSTFKNADVDAWLKSIQELEERAKPTRTVVGVVGNTGAGKSSVINALLDEERLLPTNCLRACTASPTEISYNYSDDPTELYRAEVEFITKDEWIRELEVLFNDLLDGNGDVSRECSNADSEAGVAYAKLKAVYPHKTKEMIAMGTPNDFAAEASVRGVLGSVKKLREGTARALYGRLQHYVDSKEKITGIEHRKRNIPIEYWPLIKVVRIYTKANALSTGALIVDLPGVQDSNAARAAVAEKYMKSCTGLWIVAPITRAVDDKTAKSLLGDSFKRQLKYDGTYLAVSFICSKTDDISITEAVDSLGLEEEIAESWNRAEELETSNDASEVLLAELRSQKSAFAEQLDEIEVKYDIWDDLLSKVSDGMDVYAPVENPKKRKRQAKPHGSRKNRDSYDSEAEDGSYSFEDDSSDKENSQSNEDRQPLTEDDIDQQLTSFRSQRKKIRQERRELDAQIADTRKQIQDAELERQDILAEVKARCIRGRNEYSRGAIKQDFAMGIKELDQENAAEEDDTTFDPDQDLRDYDEVARSLPVFCVSSRAYQKINGRLQKDDFRSHGFMSAEDTEVPQLQQHAKKLTEAGRASHCRRFLNDLAQITNSMKIWATNDGTHSTLTDVEQRREEMHLRKLLNDLETGFEASIEEAMKLVHQSLNEHVYHIFNSSVPLAANAAPSTAAGWGAHKSLGGLVWATYKATVRRNGVYSGAAGPRDFNQELVDPISRNLATGWERAFQRRLPAILDEFAAKTKKQLKEFHQAARARAEKRHTNVAGIVTLSSQILAHMRTLEQLPIVLRATITDLQREANREFTPAICHAMAYAYQVCSDERGQGSFNRMKTAMSNHVDTSRNTMFREATDIVKARLDAMCRTVRVSMTDEMEEMFASVFRDYMRVLVGTTVDRHAKLPPEELAMRANVNNVLQGGDSMFAPVLGELHTDVPEMGDDAVRNDLPEEMAWVKSEAASEAEALPVDMEVDHPMHATNDSLTRAEADDLMQQQIRSQSEDDGW
ncbi:hypothetical protein F4677DRAFT_431751 [Hypoxylon crocopeplum]|nr:hypothetical protein F4677DRAFT_431751 [Hypoxylon crocopeplum]